MSDADEIRARLLQLDTLTLFEGSLEAALLAKAAARLQQAGDCATDSDDDPDIEAAEALATLAGQIAAIRQNAALLHRRDTLLRETAEADEAAALSDIENHMIDAVGFRLRYESAEDFLRNLVSDLEAHADKAANED